MRRCIAVLEDNEERIAVMAECLADKFPFFEHRFFRSAPEIVGWLENHAIEVICLALDHDLERSQDQPHLDPGSAREVVRFINNDHLRYPVILHTTNVPAAIAMEAELEEQQWTVQRITPYGDLEWIAEAWLPMVRRAVVDSDPPLAIPTTTTATRGE